MYRRDEKRTDVFEKPDVDITLGNPKCRWKRNTTTCVTRKQGRLRVCDARVSPEDSLSLRVS
jgi:hypothetical protein